MQAKGDARVPSGPAQRRRDAGGSNTITLEDSEEEPLQSSAPAPSLNGPTPTPSGSSQPSGRPGRVLPGSLSQQGKPVGKKGWGKAR